MVTEPATISPADRMYTVELALKKKKSMNTLTQNRNPITITKKT